MNEEQRDKLSQAFLEESLLCANRNDIEESIELVQMSVSVKWHHTIKKIIDGDRKLLEKVMNDQFSSNKVEVIISRCIMNVLAKNEDFIKKNNLRVEWRDI